MVKKGFVYILSLLYVFYGAICYDSSFRMVPLLLSKDVAVLSCVVFLQDLYYVIIGIVLFFVAFISDKNKQRSGVYYRCIFIFSSVVFCAILVANLILGAMRNNLMMYVGAMIIHGLLYLPILLIFMKVKGQKEVLGIGKDMIINRVGSK